MCMLCCDSAAAAFTFLSLMFFFCYCAFCMTGSVQVRLSQPNWIWPGFRLDETWSDCQVKQSIHTFAKEESIKVFFFDLVYILLRCRPGTGAEGGVNDLLTSSW